MVPIIIYLFQGSRHNIMESVIQFNFTILYLIPIMDFIQKYSLSRRLIKIFKFERVQIQK